MKIFHNTIWGWFGVLFGVFSNVKRHCEQSDPDNTCFTGSFIAKLKMQNYRFRQQLQGRVRSSILWIMRSFSEWEADRQWEKNKYTDPGLSHFVWTWMFATHNHLSPDFTSVSALFKDSKVILSLFLHGAIAPPVYQKQVRSWSKNIHQKNFSIAL